MSDLAKAITELVKTADDALVAAIEAYSNGKHGTGGALRDTAADATEQARVLLLTVATPTPSNKNQEDGS